MAGQAGHDVIPDLIDHDVIPDLIDHDVIPDLIGDLEYEEYLQGCPEWSGLRSYP